MVPPDNETATPPAQGRRCPGLNIAPPCLSLSGSQSLDQNHKDTLPQGRRRGNLTHIMQQRCNEKVWVDPAPTFQSSAHLDPMVLLGTRQRAEEVQQPGRVCLACKFPDDVGLIHRDKRRAGNAEELPHAMSRALPRLLSTHAERTLVF